MKKDFVVPKKLGAAADMLFKLREKRYALQKEVDELEAQENQIKEYLINTLPKSDANGISGKYARVSIKSKDVLTIADWEAFYKYVHKKKAFDLLQRRISDAAIKARWENNEKVPGIDKFTTNVVSINKI